MPKQEDDQGPCSRVGSSPIVGRWWWHAGTERVYRRQKQISVQEGFPHFVSLSFLCLISHTILYQAIKHFQAAKAT